MVRYSNRGGNSGVSAFDIGPGSIVVQFTDGWFYRYTEESADAARIGQMQELALDGQGLNGFINTHVKRDYATKWC